MTDQSRRADNRYTERNFESEDRGYRGGGRIYGGERSYGAQGQRGDYRQDSRFDERRAFGGYDDPNGPAYGGYGQDLYHDAGYGYDAGDRYRGGGGYSAGGYGGDRGSALHQGYRAPFGDRSGFDRNEFQRYEGAGRSGSPYGGDRGRGADERNFWERSRDEVSSWFGDDDAARRRQQDEARADHHRGRGPKDYTRSDERIREDVNDRLTDDYLLDASSIQVKVEKGEVTLTGQVSTRYDKRRAEDLADQVGGVKHVQNNLRATDRDAAAARTNESTGSEAYSASGATSQTSGARSN